MSSIVPLVTRCFGNRWLGLSLFVSLWYGVHINSTLPLNWSKLARSCCKFNISIQINIPRRSRGFFIDGRSPMLLAHASRRVGTVWHSRKDCYLPPVNRLFRSSASSFVPPPYLRLAGALCILRFSLHFFLRYPRNILCIKILGCDTCTSTLDTFRISLSCFCLLSIPWSSTLNTLEESLQACGYGPDILPPR